MVGAVVENLSNRKLLALVGILVVIQTLFFLLGGIIAPAPSSALEVLMLRCQDTNHWNDRNKWFYPRPQDNKGCKLLEGSGPFYDLTPNDIVFVAQIPLPRDNMELEYSPWQSSLLGILMPEITYDASGNWHMGHHPELSMDVRLGYRSKDDKPDAWKELVHTKISRELDCSIDQLLAHDNTRYNCTPIELFELGSNDYPYYLLNIRIPVLENDTANRDIGRWEDLTLIAINQNGGFTKVWLALKTVVTPIVLLAVIWYWRRIKLLPRGPNLIEKSLLTLGITMTFLNFPVEWFSLWVRMPFMLLLSDIRQGIFYAMLASFWLIFTGEHLMDDVGKNRLSYYWKHLSAVLFGCACMFIFDMCERGVHLTNPFYSIWATSLGTNLAYGFIVMAAISACVYFAFLCVLIGRVIMTIKRRRANMLALDNRRRLRVEAVVYRFKFLMLATLICAALTVAGFIMGQIGDGQLRWGDIEESPRIHYTSAFLTGVYGMWNTYVFLLLALYAPSHKQYSGALPVPNDDNDDFGEPHVTEQSALQTFRDAGRIAAE